MSTEIAPALSAAEWTGVLAQHDGLAHLREQFGALPFSAHAIAALLLYEQPFGFTPQDVQDEEEVSEYCAVMARFSSGLALSVFSARQRSGGMRPTKAFGSYVGWL